MESVFLKGEWTTLNRQQFKTYSYLKTEVVPEGVKILYEINTEASPQDQHLPNADLEQKALPTRNVILTSQQYNLPVFKKSHRVQQCNSDLEKQENSTKCNKPTAHGNEKSITLANAVTQTKTT